MKTSLRSHLAIFSTALVFASASTFAQSTGTTPGTSTSSTGAATGAAGEKPKAAGPAEKKFVKDTAQSIYFEIQLAEMGKSTGGTAGVKALGELVNKELNKAWEDLGPIATSKGEPLVAQLAGSDKGTVERLKKTKGDGFDRVWLRDFSKEAKSLSRNLEQASKTSPDAEIKAFATTWAPIAKNYVTEADKAEKNLNKK